MGRFACVQINTTGGPNSCDLQSADHAGSAKDLMWRMENTSDLYGNKVYPIANSTHHRLMISIVKERRVSRSSGVLQNAGQEVK